MLRILFLTTFCLVCTFAMAQDFPYGELDKDALAMKGYSKDTSAHALVLDEYGYSKIETVSNMNVELVHRYHVKIKIFDHRGFKNGEIQLPYFDSEDIDSLSAQTTFTDDNGIIKTVEIDPKKIYRVNEAKSFNILKFAMPGMRSGCIIEFRYRYMSHVFSHFHPWFFQGPIPKMHSEYEFSIPAYWRFNASMRGDLKFSKSFSEIDGGCFKFQEKSCDCTHSIYEMKDIPAFVTEDYLTSPRNYLSAMYFEMSEYTRLGSYVNISLTKTWNNIDYDIKHSSYTGDQMKRKGLFKDRIAPLIAGKTDSLEKAKAVYAYIQKNIKWNGVISPESFYGIGKALDDHVGNSGDINLALIAALGAAGIKADAVLLSTREHGFLNKLYPLYENFNYLVAMVNIGGTNYFLDATDQYMPFGVLPFKCLNDQGRVISLDKPSYWTDITTGQKKSISYNFDLTLQKDGKITGTMTRYSGSYEGYERRRMIKKYNSIDEYIDSQEGSLSRFKLLKSEITNLDSLDLPVSETYQVEIKAANDFKADRISFNPVLFDSYSSNPLKMTERTYPVDYGMTSTERFTLTLHLPEGYTVDELPKDVGLTLPGDGGKFISGFQNNDNTVTFTRIIQLNKPVYTPEEYPYLKEFYNKIILSQNVGIMIKKKVN